jgi:DMSO reductase family type II enzyme heme b subunit
MNGFRIRPWLFGAAVGFVISLKIIMPPGWASAQETKQEKPSQGNESASTPKPVDENVQAGKAIFEQRCKVCHGPEGNGEGPAATYLKPRPRDFTKGLFKIRTTPSGKLPTDQDLFKVISQGMMGTVMPAWETNLSEKERWQVISYVKTFAKKFARLKEPPTSITVGERVPSSPESIERGKKLFKANDCFKCHGEEGRADGASALDLKDEWDIPIRPANLTRNWNFRGGNKPEDIYTRISTGLMGTPMPSFSDTLSNNDIWDLVNFILSLAAFPERPRLKPVMKAKQVTGPLPSSPNDPKWREAEVFEFPLAPQFIPDQPLFTPIDVAFDVSALYNDKEIAIRVVWDDPTNSKPNADPKTYEDAIALLFPVQTADGPHTGNLWRWRSDTREVAEATANSLEAVISATGKSNQVGASATYKDGQYKLVLKRALVPHDKKNEIEFGPGKLVPIAFLAWDGSNNEHESNFSMSRQYYYLFLEAPTPVKVILPYHDANR